eukprot:TRINITY_DN67442_c0_g1_i1.p1 TRINITY_DN67442_c0_g1~~TRINITY_DN67442_c0_g1_i1.p1  ORF type:complete len:140 (-),score=29.52 TRINITY_DN67442_c0_g1_i1:146-508(-)
MITGGVFFEEFGELAHDYSSLCGFVSGMMILFLGVVALAWFADSEIAVQKYRSSVFCGAGMIDYLEISEDIMGADALESIQEEATLEMVHVARQRGRMSVAPETRSSRLPELQMRRIQSA